MDPSTFYAQGNAEFVEERYAEAVNAYNVAIELADDQAAYFRARAAAQLKLGEFAAALSDAAAAVRLDESNATGQFRLGLANFYLGSYSDALASFKRASSLESSAVWIRKCEAELSGSALPLKGTVAAPAAAAPAAAAPAAAAPAPAVAPAPPSAVPAGPDRSDRKVVKHEWYQTPTHVILTIFAKKVEQDKISVDHMAPDEVIVSITLPGSGSEEYQLHLDLFAAVEAPEMSILPMKVELKMKKVAAQNWADLQKVMTVAPAAYPTSNRAKKDWDAIEKDVSAEMDAEKPQGDEALNKLFKDIYGNASEETRRAMIKSFQTSGGTVLSTNWDDVSKADYEGKDRPSAPEGQQWADEKK